MLAQVACVVSASAPSREQFAIISFSILKKLHHCCSRSEIIVYNALALHADPSGHCWPGRARLAMITGLSERQISRATAELARKGLLAKEGFPGGRVDYWLLPATTSTPSPAPAPTPTPAPTPVTSKALPPDTDVTPP